MREVGSSADSENIKENLLRKVRGSNIQKNSPRKKKYLIPFEETAQKWLHHLYLLQGEETIELTEHQHCHQVDE